MTSTEQKRIVLTDPSEYRPEYRDKASYRDFNIHTCPARVIDTYKSMHTFQTVEYVRGKIEHYCKFNHAEMTMMEALNSLDAFLDESDPDVDIPNSLHGYQTAEAIRRKHPDKDWFHVVGLIHDAGKVMAHWGEPQWSTVGDTFPVGCLPDDRIVFGRESFKDNPDMKDEKFNTRLGMYEENCGLDKVLMSWGHDEYLYRVLTSDLNTCRLPEEGLYMIRYHSFYPWHTSGAYGYLCNNKDEEMKDWINEFNKFDLYTKSAVTPNVDELQAYYSALMEKYIPGKVKW
ncbi:inositol oxygenase-like [Mizuhopecten yessoensis]|uniref:Inositol oxygenase n=1 Tax=Mizuhopecten yessoensis TaxID=6573 RepID=A0A210QT11_MIZYE|nr:inositol oxygenase-like [Mizuhopecten yessoensis]OWF51858.1 Inositol oxygenase [Mizuhopecten yessoensis]